MAGAFGTITLGDTAGAAKQAAGQAGYAGMTGLNACTKSPVSRMSKLPTARRDRASGTLALRVSADSPGPETDQASSGAKAHGIGDAGYGIGVERPGDEQNVVAGHGAGLGDASVKVDFGSNNDNDPAAEDDAHGASASFVSGSATFTAFASNNDDLDRCGTGAGLDPGR